MAVMFSAKKSAEESEMLKVSVVGLRDVSSLLFRQSLLIIAPFLAFLAKSPNNCLSSSIDLWSREILLITEI